MGGYVIPLSGLPCMEKKKDVKNRPMISPDRVSHLNPYLANKWLFDGLDGKKKN